MRAPLISGILAFFAIGLGSAQERDAFLSWSDKQASNIGRSMRAKGRVGGWLDTRVVHTEHSYNYELRGALLTPEVIRASARMHQLLEGLDDEETLDLVKEAENHGDTVVLVGVDPREGSGIIPRDWAAFLRPKSDGESGGLRGVNEPELRTVKALSGTERRDYSYVEETGDVPPLVVVE
jgi:hypothetical protein